MQGFESWHRSEIIIPAAARDAPDPGAAAVVLAMADVRRLERELDAARVHLENLRRPYEPMPLDRAPADVLGCIAVFLDESAIGAMRGACRRFARLLLCSNIYIRDNNVLHILKYPQTYLAADRTVHCDTGAEPGLLLAVLHELAPIGRIKFSTLSINTNTPIRPEQRVAVANVSTCCSVDAVCMLVDPAFIRRLSVDCPQHLPRESVMTDITLRLRHCGRQQINGDPWYQSCRLAGVTYVDSATLGILLRIGTSDLSLVCNSIRAATPIVARRSGTRFTYVGIDRPTDSILNFDAATCIDGWYMFNM